MTDVQACRGPDDAGVWEHHAPDGSYFGLGSRRLAILDLTPAGHMPMTNEDGTLWITYNGEVYNFAALRGELQAKGHTFRSDADTEVILHLYEEEGPECVKRLNGMFALAIADVRRETLFLARDHFGVKPLYYVHRAGRFAFASEIKALLQLPDVRAEVDLGALHQYLTMLWVPDPRTMFQGIYKLPAGHSALFHQGQLQITQYWDLTMPPAGAAFRVPETELIDGVRERLRRSVERQMVSDVPVGAFLSAGLDSGSIVAMMAEASPRPVRTYTITFPARDRAGESTLDDPAVAARVAQRFGCQHHEIVVQPQVADLLPRLVWQMDEPVADPAIIMSYLVCREARQSATVLLSGVGGDEIFGGYRKYVAQRWAAAYRGLPGALRDDFIGPAVTSLPSLRGTPFKGAVRLAQKMARSASLAPMESFLMNSTYLDAAETTRLYRLEVARAIGALDPWEQHRAHFARVDHAAFLNQMLYVDTKTFMASLNLTYNDKMSMASSVEVRVPFLDRDLAEFVAWQVPPNMKVKGFLQPTTKYLLRRAMRGILPEEVLRQPKAGFGAPVDAWLAHDLREMTDDLLSPSRIGQRALFEPAAVRRLIQEQRSGRRDWSMQIWQLLTLELWLQAFVDGAGSGGRGALTTAGRATSAIAVGAGR
ncbi:MAG: asparagine synthase (glutamine-hydrolyzing) [Chloroflexota bacterium]|nr:asparagine synthase (glutamine-hydrolyzing) [Chloroflexota bacterium]